MTRTGVFVCECGTNIGATIDVSQVVEAARKFPGVAHADEYKYMCSDPGQIVIKEAIEKYDLDRIVVAACSPKMHEPVFRKTISDAGLNPYMLEMANIREQVSWVHTNTEQATLKAIDLVKMSVAKVSKNFALFSSTIPVNKNALVVGGGIAGIQAALDIADAGYQVTMVEKESTIGGKMALLDKTFPTMDCSACICSPKMVTVSQHPNIELMSSSEIEKVDGYIGNFEVTIKQRAKYVDHDECTGCGICETKCPVKVPSEFDRKVGKRPAIYKAFAQAVPSKPVIDAENCRYLQSGKCGICEKVCPVGCIKYDDEDKFVKKEFGAIVLATGYELINWKELYGEYGYGKYEDIIDGLQFERMVNASGPTDGKILRPSDGEQPKNIVFIKCVGSRDENKGKSYCSRACCMYTAKHAHQVLDAIPDAKAFVSYMDVRCAGKDYDEFYMRTLQDGAVYLRGRISKIYEQNGKLICKGEDTLSGELVSIDADLVVVETAMVPYPGAEATAALAGVSRNKDGWLQEAHPKLAPVETHTGGVFVAGCAQGPKDIPDTVAQASAAAVKVCKLFSKDEMETDPMIANVTPEKCSGCQMCLVVCPYKAITLRDMDDWHLDDKITRQVADVNSGLCQGCGACIAACRPGAIDLLGFTNAQILEEVDALCQ